MDTIHVLGNMNGVQNNRRSSLSFELPLSFEQAVAYRKANGQYVRKNSVEGYHCKGIHRP